MKSDRQYRDAALGAFIGWIGIILMCLIMVMFGCTEFNNGVQEGLKNDPRPLSPIVNYLPPTFYDTTGMQREMDSIDDYMRHWYEVLDTNSDGDIDDIEYNKETKVWTGTNQGEYTYEEQLSIEPDFIYYDTSETQE